MLDLEYGNFADGKIEFVDRVYEQASKKASKVPPVPPVTATVAELRLTIPLPQKAIVLEGTVTVTAKAAGNTAIGNVAQVRALSGDPVASSTELVVDFGGMRTVSAVVAPAPAAVQAVRAWLGTKFDTSAVANSASFGGQGLQFPEVQTERLQLTLSAGLNPTEAMAHGTVVMTTPPADLELLVDGTRAWFRPGAAPAGFTQPVPVAPLLQAAVDAGHVPVEVVLKSRVAGVLGLTAGGISFLRTHVVVFSGGTTLDVDMAEEGPVTVALPLPPEASTWQVRRVDAVVTGDPGPGRVIPPTGPAPSPDVLVALDPDRSVVVRLPRQHVRRLARLTAVRVLVAAGAGGAELGGTLRADADGNPGDPLPGGTLGPVKVPAAAASATGAPIPAWVTLPVAEPLDITDPDAFIWASIQCSRGQVTWPLGAPSAAGPPAADLVARIRRQLPNGNYRPLSAPRDVATESAVLRVAGEPPPDTPVPLLEGGIGGTGSTTPFTPSADGVTLKLGADPAVTMATPGAFAGGALLLTFTSTSPGRLKVGPVTVAYTTPGGTP